jgi:hypothetical protein
MRILQRPDRDLVATAHFVTAEFVTADFVTADVLKQIFAAARMTRERVKDAPLYFQVRNDE